MTKVAGIVLDASAMIAVLRNEKGAELVQSRWGGAWMSAVNYSEVIKKTVERGGSPAVPDEVARAASLTIVPFDRDRAGPAGVLYAATKHLGLSFADRACLSLGIHLNALILTTEGKFDDATVGANVMLIRPRKR